MKCVGALLAGLLAWRFVPVLYNDVQESSDHTIDGFSCAVRVILCVCGETEVMCFVVRGECAQKGCGKLRVLPDAARAVDGWRLGSQPRILPMLFTAKESSSPSLDRFYVLMVQLVYKSLI